MNGGSEDKPPPIHDTPILGMKTRPRVTAPTEYGNASSWWVEYPSGLVDLSRSTHLGSSESAEPARAKGLWDVSVDGDRTIRIDAAKSALVVIDMQK